jgi:hypothetical protein
MLTRYEFIGEQNGQDVSEHRFAHSFEDAAIWLNEEKISNYVIGYAGFVPENYVVPLKVAILLFNSIEDRFVWDGKKVDFLHILNYIYLELLTKD